MAPPSKLKIATGVVTRLVKEEKSYHKEIVQQEARIKKAETSTGDENAEYTLKQEVRIDTFHGHVTIVERTLTPGSVKHSRRPRTYCLV